MRGDEGSAPGDPDARASVGDPAAPGADTDGVPEGAGDDELSRLLSSALLERPAVTVNAFEETVHRLVQSVQLGLVGPGERLPAERELATMLGVSRDTVREAIGALASAGHLVSRRGRYGGTFVVRRTVAADGTPGQGSSLSPGLATGQASTASLEDTLALRSVLEVGTARRVATMDLTAADRDLLWRTHETLRAVEPADYRRHDTHLHLLLGQLVGAPQLVTQLADVRMRINAYLDRIPLLVPNLVHSDEQHERIVTAVLTGRPDDAAAAMAEHLDGTEKLLRGFLG